MSIADTLIPNYWLTPYLSDIVIQEGTIFKIPFIELFRNYIMNEFWLLQQNKL